MVHSFPTRRSSDPLRPPRVGLDRAGRRPRRIRLPRRSEEHTSELQSHHPISYAVFCLKKKTEYLKTKQKGRDHEPVTSNDVYDTVAALEPLAEEQRISIFPFFF